MTTKDFVRRCTMLRAESASLAATMLGLSRSGCWRIWTGERPVSAAVEARLERAEKHLPRALTAAERRLLAGAAKVGDQLVPPAPRSNFDRGMVWDRVMDRLARDKLVRVHRDRAGLARAEITRRGLAAIRFYDGAP